MTLSGLTTTNETFPSNTTPLCTNIRSRSTTYGQSHVTSSISFNFSSQLHIHNIVHYETPHFPPILSSQLVTIRPISLGIDIPPIPVSSPINSPTPASRLHSPTEHHQLSLNSKRTTRYLELRHLCIWAALDRSFSCRSQLEPTIF